MLQQQHARPPARGASHRGARLRPRAPCTRVRASATSEDECKRAAARLAVDRFVKDDAVVGLGSGDMVAMAIEYIGLKLQTGELKGVVGVAASTAAASEAAFHGLPLASPDAAPALEVLLEEADQVDPAGGAALKGTRAEPQQPELARLRELLAAARQLVLLVEARNVVPRLCASLPVFVAAADWEESAEALDDVFLGDAEIWRRPTSGAANPRGGDRPYMSPEGCHIVDVRFYEGLKLFGEDARYADIAAQVEGVPGVVAHGLLSTVEPHQFTHIVTANADAQQQPSVVDAAAAAAAAAPPPSGSPAAAAAAPAGDGSQ